ncbi:hypothetical protein V6N13_026246 [Hibiscus sabdariffa]
MSTYLSDPPPPPPSSANNPSAPVVITIIFLISFLFGFIVIHFCKCVLENISSNRPPVEVISVPTGDVNKSNGLDPDLVQAFPTFYYSTVKESRREKYGLECAICLGEFEDDDLLRLLTICCHIFHKECVDLWLQSNKTCPVCRQELDVPRKSFNKSPVLLHTNSMHEIGANNQHRSPLLRNAVYIDIKEDVNEESDEAEEQNISPNTKEKHRRKREGIEGHFRSNSTGHSIARVREEDDSRYRLRLLDHVKIRIVRGHKAAISCISFGDFNYTNAESIGEDIVLGYNIIPDHDSLATNSFSSLELQAGSTDGGALSCLPMVNPKRRSNGAEGSKLQTVQGRRKRRRKPRVCKNREEAQTQRMTHIAVERNRRKQMNEHLGVLRSLMPQPYVQRGDQTSIVSGAIEFVKELEHLLQTLAVRKLRALQQKQQTSGNELESNSSNNFLPLSSSSFSSPFALFFKYPQYTWSQNPNKHTSNTKVSIADIEVTLIQTHANLRILSRKAPKQLPKLVAGFRSLHLSILHLNVEEGCQLSSVDDIAEAVHNMLRMIEEDCAAQITYFHDV